MSALPLDLALLSSNLARSCLSAPSRVSRIAIAMHEFLCYIEWHRSVMLSSSHCSISFFALSLPLNTNNIFIVTKKKKNKYNFDVADDVNAGSVNISVHLPRC